DTNCTYMNKGIVVKFSANQKYTTDAISSAVFAGICETAGVPVQHFANRSDAAGGSTLGNLSSQKVSMHTVDI
ncbi:M18 family aminopeptidase, partial [Erysipelatoclostridium ramosum]|nr:M18 family aminopeptidase [Thomasclavelia ramosa]